jgi:hypothetical protein
LNQTAGRQAALTRSASPAGRTGAALIVPGSAQGLESAQQRAVLHDLQSLAGMAVHGGDLAAPLGQPDGSLRRAAGAGRPARPLQSLLHHLHQRGLAGAPGALDPYGERRSCVGVLDDPRDGVHIGVVATVSVSV